ncbi:hypothetical protein [Micromonospora sp. NPDC126480]|uniref:hypothetical protein n=1 Tax=Micromonospora sp. NPDC126480 TaxID=3155312 RepID=UPI0033244EE5
MTKTEGAVASAKTLTRTLVITKAGVARVPYPQPVLPPCPWLAVSLTRAELGDVATWIGSIANVATLGLALVAGIVGFQVYKIESDRDMRAEDERRERALDERRAQAELVSTWFAKGEPSALRTRSGSGSGSGRTILWGDGWWGANIFNASNLPIYDVVVFFRPSEIAGHPDRVDEYAIPSEAIRVVPPHQGEVMVPMPNELHEAVPAENRQHMVDVSMEFRDAAGQRWLRDWEGFLIDITPKAGDLRGRSLQALRRRYFR